jgi:magnesium chelatase subunit I
VAAGALRRAAIVGEQPAVARACDLPAVVPTLLGKVEFEVSEEGREQEVLEHLLRRATAETYRRTLGAADLAGLLDKFDAGETVESGELVASSELLHRIGPVPGLVKIMERLGMTGESPGQAAAALEFAMEGLFLTRRLSKDATEGRLTYRT